MSQTPEELGQSRNHWNRELLERLYHQEQPSEIDRRLHVIDQHLEQLEAVLGITLYRTQL